MESALLLLQLASESGANFVIDDVLYHTMEYSLLCRPINVVWLIRWFGGLNMFLRKIHMYIPLTCELSLIHREASLIMSLANVKPV